MVRGKIQLKKIENAASRQVTFSKRRSGLMKKAYELSVLCDAEVALIIFSQRGRLLEFASSDMQSIIERYRRYVKEDKTNNVDIEQQIEQVKREIAILVNKIQVLEMSKRKFLGQCPEQCSMEELQETDSRLEQSLRSIRAKKLQLFNQKGEDLKAKEKFLLEENQVLHKKLEAYSSSQQQQPTIRVAAHNGGEASTSTQAFLLETQLFIGLPQMR